MSKFLSSKITKKETEKEFQRGERVREERARWGVSGCTRLRPELELFAAKMEEVLAENDRMKGDSYKTMPLSELRRLLFDNKDKYCHKVRHNRCRRADIGMGEIIDVANYCFMLYYRGIHNDNTGSAVSLERLEKTPETKEPKEEA